MTDYLDYRKVHDPLTNEYIGCLWRDGDGRWWSESRNLEVDDHTTERDAEAFLLYLATVEEAA